jgi:RNA-binding motif protein, X-linked 2
VSGLDYRLTEGDVITIFSQYGEGEVSGNVIQTSRSFVSHRHLSIPPQTVADVNMPRDPKTSKTRGFAFLMYEDQRSTVLAVDNLNGSKVLERTLRVDHGSLACPVPISALQGQC